MISAEACAEAAQQMATLSEREREVIVLAGKVLNYLQTAQALSIKPHTVNEYRAAALRKLGLKTKVEAVVVATKAGLV